MSIINDIVIKHIHNYDRAKTGEWHKKEPPPSNTFEIGEIYMIGKAITSEIEGMIADKILKER